MRLIDEHRLIEELNEAQVEGDELYKGLGKAKAIVCYQPTIDAVPVVRCKDCKWLYVYIEAGEVRTQCAYRNYCFGPWDELNGFCEKGEIKDDSN